MTAMDIAKSKAADGWGSESESATKRSEEWAADSDKVVPVNPLVDSWLREALLDCVASLAK